MQDGIILSCKIGEKKYDKDYNMGSRGQALKSGGFTEYKYHTIARYNNVRFVVQNDNWNKHYKLTEMSNSPWAIYAEADSDGKLRTITFYNGSRKKFKEVDLDKPHKGLSPHIHECDPKTSLRFPCTPWKSRSEHNPTVGFS